MRSITWTVLPLVMLASACNPGSGGIGDRPQLPTPTSFNVVPPPEETTARLESTLRRLGFDTISADPQSSVVRASASGAKVQEWAQCPRRRITDDHGGDDSDTIRVRFVEAHDPEVELTVRVSPAAAEAAGTRIEIDREFTGKYRNNFRATILERPCGSTGALERALREGVQGTA